MAKIDKTATADAAPPAARPADGPLEALESVVAAPSALPATTLAAPPSAAPAPLQPSRADRLDAAIDDWMRQHIHSSPLSRDTVAWNHLRAKLPALRDALMEI